MDEEELLHALLEGEVVSGYDDYDDYDDDELDLVEGEPDLILDENGQIIAGHPEEVGRLLGRRGRRRLRNFGAFLGGGPLGLAIARRRQKRRRRQRRQREAAAAAAARPPVIVQAQPRRPRTAGNRVLVGSDRRLQLPFETKQFGPGDTLTLKASPLKGIQPDRLVIQVSAPRGTVIVREIKHGVDSQMAGNGAMPVEAFNFDADTGALQLAPMPTGSEALIILDSLETPPPAPGPDDPPAPVYTASAVMFGVAAD